MIVLPLVQIHESILIVNIHGKQKHFPLKALPAEFIEWQIGERRSLFQSLQQGKEPVFLSPHLPTLLSLNRDFDDFPVNAACKGVGLVPIDSLLETLAKRLRSINAGLQDIEFKDSLPDRTQAVELLFGDKEKINQYALGGLEIFETKSFLNITQDPRVSLFFVTGSPTYKSYQMNCIAEVIDSGQPFYEFVTSTRNLFERAKFHFKQTKYPYAIKYHVVEILDKSLQVRGQ